MKRTAIKSLIGITITNIVRDPRYPEILWIYGKREGHTPKRVARIDAQRSYDGDGNFFDAAEDPDAVLTGKEADR